MSFQDDVKEAIKETRARVPTLRKLMAQFDGRMVTLRGEAPDLRTKARAAAVFNGLVDTKNTINNIRLKRPVQPENPAKRVKFSLGDALQQLLLHAGQKGPAPAPARGRRRPEPQFQSERVAYDEVRDDELQGVFGRRHDSVHQKLAARHEKQWAQLARQQNREREQLERQQAGEWEQLERELDQLRRSGGRAAAPTRRRTRSAQPAPTRSRRSGGLPPLRRR
ncbi:MAG: hypothetical protein AAF533_17025 [Acidobacteriota bacterium]